MDLKANAENYSNHGNDTSLNQPSFCVAFHDVGFVYKNNEGFALNGLNFAIPDKGMTAIVGKSGAGKSTIVDLLLGLIRPTLGYICVNSTPIDESNIRNWRKCIGYVTQDPFLFNGTI